IVGVHVEAGAGERLDQCSVSARMLADAVQQLHDAARVPHRIMHIVDDGDPVGVDELRCSHPGHADESTDASRSGGRVRIPATREQPSTAASAPRAENLLLIYPTPL